MASLNPELITKSPANFPREGKVLLDLTACRRAFWAKAPPPLEAVRVARRACLTPQGEVVVDLQTKGDIFTEP